MVKWIFPFFLLFKISAKECPSRNHALICHAASIQNPNYGNLCVDFASLWGHFHNHELDYYGACQPKEVTPFVCNVGLRHPLESTELKTCDSQENSCQASTPPRINSHRFDFMKMQKAIFTDDFFNKFVFDLDNQDFFSEMEFFFQQKFSGIDSFELATNDPYHTVIKNDSLSFNLGSERIGSEYFVDICWANTAYEPLDKNYINRTTLSILTQTRNYLEMAKVDSKYSLFCDHLDSGPISISTFSDFETAYSPYRYGQKIYSAPILGARFCIARVLFKESEEGSLREHKVNHVKLEINSEFKLEGDISEKPIEICHVLSLEKNEFICQNLYFQNSQEYKNYILTYSDSFEWRQEHQFDYQGRCESYCGPLNGNQ